MSTQPIQGILFSSKARSGAAVRTALAVCVALVISVPSLWAAQTPKEAAISTSSTISALIQANDANFATDAADAVNNLINADNNEADSIAIISTALGTISQQIAHGTITSTLSAAQLLAGDTAIGTAVTANANLEALTKNGLLTVIEDSITDVNGLRGKSPTAGPEAADAFVKGLIANAFPDGATPGNFAVTILKHVAKNASIAEFVSYEVGLKDNASDTTLSTLAAALYASYSKDVAKITQGIVAVEPQQNNTEGNRVSLITSLVSTQPKQAVSIDAGATFTDPFFAGDFTGATFGALTTPLLGKDAGRIAISEGAVLGQDGNSLTDVAQVYAQAIGSGKLLPKNAAAYLTDLIGGAAKSKVPASQFTGAAAGGGGGQLNGGVKQLATSITFQTLLDLASITDLLGGAIITADNATLSGKGLTAAEGQVEALAAAVAKFTKNEIVTDPNNAALSGPASSFLAASLADEINGLLTGLNAADSGAFQTAIDKGVGKDTSKAVREEVDAEVAAFAQYPAVGVINTQETAVTNL